MQDERLQFWLDVGGTFTDCIARGPGGALRRCKVLSSGAVKGVAGHGSDRSRIVDRSRAADPPDFWRGYRCRIIGRDGQSRFESVVEGFDPAASSIQLAAPLPANPELGARYELSSGEGAPLLAIRQMLKLRLDESLPPLAVFLGTTRGTNALLTRGGARTALVTTRGFGDILRIGYQNRPRLFDLAIRKPPPLFEQVLEIDERLTADGEVLAAPDESQVRAGLAQLAGQGVESLAICLLNAYCNPRHEQLVEQLARETGFAEISVSSRVAPFVKLVSRGDTTVVDAYLNPVLRDYVQKLRAALGPHSELRLLTSAGGLVAAEQFVGKDSILSGPAGGVVGFARAAQAAGFEKAIGFDMGGTSTDVSRFDGRFELEYETEKAGARIVAPMMAIETVAAGGGSICRFDGVKLAVGPESAGAQPGPACYGSGGPLTVTDMNLVLGRIAPEHFPFPLDRGAAEEKLQALSAEIADRTGQAFTPVELADGFLQVANANMAQAIRSISIAKGYDVRDYLLVAFGGAAMQHACDVARELGVGQILSHPDAGVLSAYGIGLADVIRHRACGVYQSYHEAALHELEATLARLEDEARGEVLAEGVAPERIECVRSLDLRYRGFDACLTVRQPDSGSFADRYEEQSQQLYGFSQPGRALEIVAARVEAIGRSPASMPATERRRPRTPVADSSAAIYFDAQKREAPLFQRQNLRPGDTFAGPALVAETTSTTVVAPNWRAEMLTGGELLITRAGQADEADVSTEADPIMLEIFNNQFASIAEQMGVTLQNTSSSVNVKERLDFSCAIFTAAGELVANAPHIPVHLGAMGETVKCVLQDNPDLGPGDVFVTNDPFRGGSHLPDVTVVTPVHDPASRRLLFFAASRAHHAEIGGSAPGSMPPFSRNLAEEGVLIANFRLVAGGQSRFDELRRLLLSGEYPTRSVDDNLADIAAQVAANQQGARDLQRLAERYSLPVVEAYMGHIQQAAEKKMRMVLAALGDGRREFVDRLDDGSPIAVAVTIAGGSAKIDFTGTGSVLVGNLNANRAIVTAAVMYCLRCLIDEDIPLNQGVLAPIEIVLPECLLNPPRKASPGECAAVVGGNVETSQRVVDVLLGALGAAAASQGTMNNVLFGDDSFGYYETICGGAGATHACDGADAVHTHMTNTRLTDPEVLEKRYPVRVQEFSIRAGSGGRGEHSGGCGVVRKLLFLRDLQVSILSQRRGEYPPYGIDGGASGAIGVNTLIRGNGRTERLPALARIAVSGGDVLSIKTPGGGGCGEAPPQE